MTDEQVSDAIVALLVAGGSNAFTFGETPTTFPSYFTQVHVAKRIGETFTAGGHSDVQLWRVITRAVAKVERNAQRQRAKDESALDGASITVGGVQSSQIARETSDDPIRADDGWFSGTTEWVVAL